jgi:phosphoribosylformylglycinamidine synthase
VKGIGDYGNSFGVPTVAGEVYFDKSYTANPLVNAMAVGIVEHGHIARAIAKGAGNLVMIVGSSTGRDGIHGATFASEEISQASEAKRPSVQVGDPFTEKLLLEATLEAVQAGLVVGIQDMGAAGLTCSSTEMSARGRSGMRIDLDKVPLREEAMSSYEIMLSESQERMLVVVEEQHEAEVQKIFRKWDLHAVTIGEVINSDRVIVSYQGELKADVPADSLVLGGGAPVYTREARVPDYISSCRAFRADDLPVPSDYNQILLDLLASPTVAAKRWVFEQYDSMVRTNTVAPSYDAAIVRLKGTKKALALKTDCNARYVYLNPRRGGQIAVAEAGRNVVCAGAEPLGITNCLNFGNPYDPEIYWQFKEAVLGIGEACRALGTPVTGGNVSFYNENPDGAVHPTPVIGMVGLVDDVSSVPPSGFQNAGDVIVLLGESRGEVGGSEYLYLSRGEVLGDAPFIDLNFEKKLQHVTLHLIRAGLLASAHDCSEGGFAVAVAEACFCAETNVGASITDLDASKQRADFILFGESQSRIVISTNPKHLPRIIEHCSSADVPAKAIGYVTPEPILRIGTQIDLDIHRARIAYMRGIPAAMGEEVEQEV